MTNKQVDFINSYYEFYESFKKKKFKVINGNINAKIYQYSFQLISNNFIINDYPEIWKNLYDSNIMIVDKFQQKNQNNENDYYLIVSFKKSILIFDQSSIKIYKDHFSPIHAMSH